MCLVDPTILYLTSIMGIIRLIKRASARRYDKFKTNIVYELMVTARI